MTVSAAYSPDSYTATASQTTFAYTFTITDEDQIRVYQNGTLLTITTHYTVSSVGAGGNIVLVTGATAGDAIILSRHTTATQEADFVDGDALDADTLESALDKLTYIAQEMDYYVDDLNDAVTAAAGSAASAALSAAAIGSIVAASSSSLELGTAPSGTSGNMKWEKTGAKEWTQFIHNGHAWEIVDTKSVG